jgi:hypothetical protein
MKKTPMFTSNAAEPREPPVVPSRLRRLASFAAVLAASAASLATNSGAEVPSLPGELPPAPALIGPGPIALNDASPTAAIGLRFENAGGNPNVINVGSSYPEFTFFVHYRAARPGDLRLKVVTVAGEPLGGSYLPIAPSDEGFELTQSWELGGNEYDTYCERGAGCSFDARVVFERDASASGDPPGPVTIDWWEVHLPEPYVQGAAAPTVELLP